MDNNEENKDLNFKIEISEDNFKVPLTKKEIPSSSSPIKDDKSSQQTQSVKERLKNKLTEIEQVEYGKKSHLDYLKIIRENKDPINVEGRGGLKSYSMEEIKKHNNENSLWMVLDGKVFDLTLYLDYHPGGRKKLLSGAGKDATSLFSKL